MTFKCYENPGHTSTSVSVTCYEEPTMKWYRDPAIYESMSTETFWLLGIAIVANAYWISQQLEPTESGNEPKKSGTRNEAANNTPNNNSHGSDSRTTTPSSNPVWRQPQITSPTCQILVKVIYSLFLPLQLLEGFWVLKTAWRLTLAILKVTYPSVRPLTLGFILYLPATIIILAVWAVMLGIGGCWFESQFLYVVQLLNQPNLGARIRLNPGEEKKSDGREKSGEEEKKSSGEEKKSDDEGWDEFNDEEGVQGEEKNKD